MHRTAPLATALLTTLALGATPAQAGGAFSKMVVSYNKVLGLSSIELFCDDGIDNDGDGDVDSDDADCEDTFDVPSVGDATEPTIDLGGSASPGGDDVHPLPDFFLAWSDDGTDLGLYTLSSESTDRKGTTTVEYEVAVSGLASLERDGYLKGMSAGIVDADADGYDDVVLAMPSYGNGLVMTYADVAAGEQSFYDYAGYLYTDYSSYSCSAGGSTCTTNLAEGVLIDSDSNTLLIDLGYSSYYGEGSGFFWTVDETSLRSHVAEDGGLVYVDQKSGYLYYY